MHFSSSFLELVIKAIGFKQYLKNLYNNYDRISQKGLIGLDDEVMTFYIQKFKGQLHRDTIIHCDTIMLCYEVPHHSSVLL